MREKLIELLREVQYLGGLEEKIADHLIANGVTIQRWIPVTERLPEIYTQVLCFTGSSVQLAMYEGNDKWFTNYHSYTLEGRNLFTHWMPLPEAPEAQHKHFPNGDCK